MRARRVKIIWKSHCDNGCNGGTKVSYEMPDKDECPFCGVERIWEAFGVMS